MDLLNRVDLNHKEMVFLLYALNSFREDIQDMISAVILNKEQNAKVSEDWLLWLKQTESDLRQKICGELPIGATNLLTIFNQERGEHPAEKAFKDRVREFLTGSK